VYLGDTITACVEVAEILPDRNRVCLRTVCLNQDGQAVLEGDAWVMPSQVHIEYAEPKEHRGWAAAVCAPATFAVQTMSFWAAAGLAIANQAAQLYRMRPGARPAPRS
jgi:hypothetical protein